MNMCMEMCMDMCMNTTTDMYVSTPADMGIYVCMDFCIRSIMPDPAELCPVTLWHLTD